LYERQIRAQVEADNKGRMLAIDIESGDYAVADDSLSALNQIKAKRADGTVCMLRIGFPTAVKIGAGRKPTTP